jgi:hypothetical protein
MASRAMVKCDEDLPVVDADRGKHARALRIQRSCARVRVACSGVRTTYVRVHLCWDLSCSRARAARAKFATEGRRTRETSEKGYTLQALQREHPALPRPPCRLPVPVACQ